MIIGNGMVAFNFANYKDVDDVVIFASGVSNSKATDRREFDREKDLLRETIAVYKQKKIVYFSTFNLYDPQEQNSPYCLHKLNMEACIEQNALKYNIFRLGHVAGSSAKQYTILSFLYNAIQNEIPFNLWEYASRNIIDIDDISKICTYIIDHDMYPNQITNVCNSLNTTIPDIVSILEKMLGKKGFYTTIEKGGAPSVDNSNIRMIAKDLGINFDEMYTQRVINKYYRNV